MQVEYIPVNGQFRLEIWLDCNYCRFTIGLNTAVSFSFLPRKYSLPIIIKTEIRTKSGMPIIKDQIARLNLPIKNSSINSAIAMIKMNIITLKNPNKERTVIHICSVSCFSSGLSKALRRSIKETRVMTNAKSHQTKCLRRIRTQK